MASVAMASTVGLDPIQIREIRDLILGLAAPEQGREQQTVILSTHILPEVEALCQRVVLIDRGRKSLDRSLADLTAGGDRLEDVFARVTSADTAETEPRGRV